jgi:hypothetical protein
MSIDLDQQFVTFPWRKLILLFYFFQLLHEKTKFLLFLFIQLIFLLLDSPVLHIFQFMSELRRNFSSIFEFFFDFIEFDF